jgi:hypothetical protein
MQSNPVRKARNGYAQLLYARLGIETKLSQDDGWMIRMARRLHGALGGPA